MMKNFALKEIDLFSLQCDGRKLNIQYDRYNKVIKVCYADEMTGDFVINIHQLQMIIAVEKHCVACNARIDNIEM